MDGPSLAQVYEKPCFSPVTGIILLTLCRQTVEPLSRSNSNLSSICTEFAEFSYDITSEEYWLTA